jgi:hypothetical protein
MATSIKGGCACGAVRYESSAEPLFAGTCHCRDCQHATGGASASALAVPKNALKITGEVRYHEVTGGSGNKIGRGFCTNCGSPVLVRPAVMPDALLIAAGSLDDPSWFKPAMDLWTSSAQPWDHMNPDLPKFPQMPPPAAG